ncbi:hypothetical protein [Listeria ilorinensis]|uniref:hypothetical protein n=1 Tax=Listeria ilorinensis TaxID=2867439 RepID=UPI001EF40E75|nr:hypothetical protein [Listeria ilorinensis]
MPKVMSNRTSPALETPKIKDALPSDQKKQAFTKTSVKQPPAKDIKQQFHRRILD